MTGILHAGHAAMLAVEDSIVRYHRMKGERTLWVPGTDHAAIATQSKVEKILMKEHGKTRHDLGREEFLASVEKFAQESHDTIVNQTKKMGSSLDWSREAYTLDAQRDIAVRTAFKTMYDDGLIYRGHRIVNWDPKLQTTVSDDEIEWETETIPFYYFQYGPFVIGTSRPETKFGDKYVVMHPDDPRYEDYADGQTFELEWVNGRVTATVIKDEAIDMTFGSGVMTITPWHDTADFEIAERHGLDKEQVISYDGKMLPIAGPDFKGLDIVTARKKIVERLAEKGLIVKIEDGYIHNIAVNSRGNGIIEPQIMLQWFIDVNKEFDRNGKRTTLKRLMQDAVRSGDIAILPDRFAKTYFHWIDNLRDWCISRQIWFGHRIPVYYCKQAMTNDQNPITKCSEPIVSIENIETCPHCGGMVKQDPDTLDTWFSSGLWTFSTLGWPTHSETAIEGKSGPENDFANYHPTNLLETGYDILFFWVARMILMTEYLLGTRPFDTVYLHGLVRDGEGRKMSKSLGNAIDPLVVSDEHGADALRLALISGSTPGNDTKLSDDKIVAMRNFTNKLWNLSRYVGTMSQSTDAIPEIISDADKNIARKLEQVVASVTEHLDKYELSLATEELRAFTWDDFADWYVEVHKIERNDALLRHVFDTILKLWHPFMPFVTEAVHQTLHLDGSEFLMIAKWPVFDSALETIAGENRFELVKDLIVKIRNLRSIYRIDPSIKMAVSPDGNSEGLIRDNEEIFKRLARVSEVRSLGSKTPKNSIPVQAGPLQAFLHLDGAVDIAAEKTRLGKELADTERYAKSIEAKLSNPNFADRAPKDVVDAERTKLDDANRKLAEIHIWLDTLG